jgi:hypothetical protein
LVRAGSLNEAKRDLVGLFAIFAHASLCIGGIGRFATAIHGDGK